MEDLSQLIGEQKEQVLKALVHLRYSYNKLETNNIELRLDDDECLETWDSFSARFVRVVDLFLVKFVRSYLKYQDPAFRGSMRDSLNMSEKLGLISDANWWLALRELRNIAAHEYNETDIANFYRRLFSETEKLLELTEVLSNFKL